MAELRPPTGSAPHASSDDSCWLMPGQKSSLGTHYVLEKPGNAPLVVFCHGIGTYHYCFAEMKKRLSTAGFATLLYDNLGMGFSDMPLEEDADFWKGTGHVAQLKALVSGLGLDSQPFFLVGHSMGGAIATLYANEHPADVRGLCLLSPAGVMTAPLNLVLLRLCHSVSCFREHILSGLQRDKVKLENIKRFGDFIDPESLPAMASHHAILRQHLNNARAIEALFLCARFFPLYSLHDTVERVCRRQPTLPILLLHGESDKTVAPEPTASFWRALMKEGGGKQECHSVPGAHLFFLEGGHPAHLDEWLRRH